ncbi:hypothetical protein B0T17DRAFT_618534 [Bombardia bombarda]|uniref:Uncharacterized protein n=1 Tax=Bombardia bombarda TaxID=252184 RepID=A0AA39WLZ9_9PEZI|nr:hypothetical protein B0T17DRAFT_618534 [Bombardia bombarda]
MVDDKKPSKLDKLKDKMGRVFGRRENHDDGSNKNDPPIQEPPPGHVPPHLRANANSNVPPENNQAQQNLVWQTPIVQGFSPPARRKGPNTRVQEAEATGRLRDSIPADYTSRPEEYHPALHGAQTTSTSILEQNKRHGFYGSPEKGKSIMRAEEKPMPKPLKTFSAASQKPIPPRKPIAPQKPVVQKPVAALLPAPIRKTRLQQRQQGKETATGSSRFAISGSRQSKTLRSRIQKKKKQKILISYPYPIGETYNSLGVGGPRRPPPPPPPPPPAGSSAVAAGNSGSGVRGGGSGY